MPPALRTDPKERRASGASEALAWWRALVASPGARWTLALLVIAAAATAIALLS